jgi:hypothetical protein
VVTGILRGFEELILNWFKARETVSTKVAKGLNNKVKLTTRKAHEARPFDTVQTDFCLNLGAFPDPQFTPRLC